MSIRDMDEQMDDRHAVEGLRGTSDLFSVYALLIDARIEDPRNHRLYQGRYCKLSYSPPTPMRP